MPEAPHWRNAWLSELLRRVYDDPRLVESCPLPIAQCLAQIAKPTGEMPEVLVDTFVSPEPPSRPHAELPVCHDCGDRHVGLCAFQSMGRLDAAYRRAVTP